MNLESLDEDLEYRSSQLLQCIESLVRKMSNSCDVEADRLLIVVASEAAVFSKKLLGLTDCGLRCRSPCLGIRLRAGIQIRVRLHLGCEVVLVLGVGELSRSGRLRDRPGSKTSEQCANLLAKKVCASSDPMRFLRVEGERERESR
jgi:hypothetical protein